MQGHAACSQLFREWHTKKCPKSLSFEMNIAGEHHSVVCRELEDGGGAVNLGCQDIFRQAIWKGGRVCERIDILSNSLESRAKQD